ncbi:MAG: tetratricopeptide repeat protein [Alistipes sp.]|nr:tetratricopeptide repeat protein [Alistipes sp.]
MAKVNKQEEILDNAELQTKSFFTKHSKKIIGFLLVAIVAAIGYAGWYFYDQSLEQDAQAEWAFIQAKYDAQTVDHATLITEVESFITKHEGTAAANLAHYYATSSALQLNDLVSATKHIEAFEEVEGEPGAVINAMAKCLKGDIAVEKKQYEEAAKLFEEAAAYKNDHTTPYALYKAAVVYQALGNEAKANELYNSIIENYPVEKYPGVAEILNAAKLAQ